MAVATMKELPHSTPRQLRVRTVGTSLKSLSYAWVATGLFAVLLIWNAVRDPGLLSQSGLISEISTAAPLILLAIAVTPSVLSGRGGIDLSLGPLAGFITVIVGAYLHYGVAGGPFVVIAVALLLGVATGAINGLIITLFRVQPIVVTLGTYLVWTGLAEQYSPSSGGVVPPWLISWTSSIGGIPIAVIVVAAVCLVWFALTRTHYYTWLIATGGDDRVPYTSGKNIATIRIVAYTFGGLVAGIAGLSLTALINGGSSSVGPPYTLVSIAAVALGGTSLAGGSGGVFGSVIGALDVFLIENLLTVQNVSVFALNLAYGAILVVAIVGNAVVVGGRGRTLILTMMRWSRTQTSSVRKQHDQVADVGGE